MATDPTHHEIPGDRVAMPSRRADGSLDQTAPRFIGPEEPTKQAIATQVAGQVIEAQVLADVDAQRAETQPEPVESEAARQALDAGRSVADVEWSAHSPVEAKPEAKAKAKS